MYLAGRKPGEKTEKAMTNELAAAASDYEARTTNMATVRKPTAKTNTDGFFVFTRRGPWVSDRAQLGVDVDASVAEKIPARPCGL